MLLQRGRGHLFNRWDIYQVRHNQFLYLLSISVWLKNFAWKIQIWSHILPKNEFHNELYYFIKECTLTMMYRYELLPFVNNFVRYYCIPKWKKNTNVSTKIHDLEKIDFLLSFTLFEILFLFIFAWLFVWRYSPRSCNFYGKQLWKQPAKSSSWGRVPAFQSLVECKQYLSSDFWINKISQQRQSVIK